MFIKRTLSILALAATCSMTQIGSAHPVETSSALTITGVRQHPIMSLTPENIRNGRENYAKHAWAKHVGDGILKKADVWIERDEAWIRQHMPPKEACFAYGFSGCPKCGGSYGVWHSADTSFETPGKVKCSNGHMLPDAEFPDDGTGYKGPDGRMHYMVGVYHAWAIEEFVASGLNLAHAYSLTGDERYAERCVQILDAMANIYLTCQKGSWDYPDTPTDPNHGRLNRPQYQVGRVLIKLADMYDQVYHSPSLDQASVNAGFTRRDNIEKNMLLDGAWYCYRHSLNFSGLHNGSADYIKGAMTVGLVLGIPEYVEWAADGPYGIKSMLANNIGRDGTYYETATGYSYYTRYIYRGFVEYLLNHRSEKYPDGINLYEDARFRSFMDLLNLRTQLNGAIPSYGDAAPITDPYNPDAPLSEKFDIESLVYLKERVKDPVLQKRYNALLRELTYGDYDGMLKNSPSATRFLFLATPLAEDATPDPRAMDDLKKTSLLGQKGMVMLRANQPDNAQGVLLRYGPSLNHGNYDDLNFNYHAFGNDLTYDLGYLLGSAHVYTGWSRPTASHQSVVVNEKNQQHQSPFTGGSLQALLAGEYTSAASASTPAVYEVEGVREYNRTLFLVEDTLPESTTTHSTYLVDVFRVAGGNSHDSFTHSLGTSVTYGHATLDSTAETSGTSLAGGDRVYGDKVLVDGDLEGHPGKPYFAPAPYNGYGFVMEPTPVTPEAESWWTEWEIPKSKNHVRVWYPRNNDDKVLSAWAPAIAHKFPQARYIIRRRQPTDQRSVFVSVWEPRADGKPTIADVAVLPLNEKSDADHPAVAIKVTHTDGRYDILYSSADETTRTSGDLAFAGKLARYAGTPADAAPDLIETVGTLTGQVTAVDSAKRTVTVTGNLAGLDIDRHNAIVFDNPAYSRNTAYRIESAASAGPGAWTLQLTETTVLGKGVVSEINETSRTLISAMTHEYLRPANRRGSTRYMDGKRIVREDGKIATVTSTTHVHPLQVRVDDVDGFEVGDVFYYEDLQPGDTFEVIQQVNAKP